MRKSLFVAGRFLVATVLLSSGCGEYEDMANPLDKESEDPLEDFRTVKEQMVTTADGTYLYLRIWGQGSRTMLAVPGGPAMNCRSMQQSLPALLGSDWTVAMFDPRGVVERSSRSPVDDYSLETQLEDIDTIRKVLGAERIYILGHSASGLLVMHYALAYRSHVAGMILFGSVPPTQTARNPGNAAWGARKATLEANDAIPATPAAALPLDEKVNQVYSWIRSYFHDPAGFDWTKPDDFEGLKWSVKMDELHRNAIFGAPPAYDLTADLASLTMPVLVTTGESDPFDGGTGLWSTPLAAAFSNATLVILPACGHFWHECMDATRDTFQAFLNP